MVDTAQTIHAKVRYIDSPLQQGILFISQHSQEGADISIVNEGFTLIYQGLSRDGKYFISAQFEITHPDIPSKKSLKPGNQDGGEAYLQRMEQRLNQFHDDSYTPSIGAIQRTIDSMQF